MKVVTLKELIEMPPGTIFSCWEPCVSRGLMWLHEKVRENDFYYGSLLPEPKTLGDGEDQPVLEHDSICRWGLYDLDETFAVYEKEDLQHFAELLTRAMTG